MTIPHHLYRYTGLAALGADRGTLWLPDQQGGGGQPVYGGAPRPLRRLVRRLSGGRRVIWFVDDERGNREWFRDYHKVHFSGVTTRSW